ncbi:uncharacterized protein KIAA1614 homolog isoform X2 [Artibeus jamaicensis]|uniref:uncharacterized protein KIAA1614 homolog isoform X2 n=1 Tax=Artibeus jamaicensis TaxID=9417 RepID=UPI00235A5A2D|nr:uncharacterized protein KIAA1614 homolog isoform X2 [Artibeus jamaicensis]
MESTQSRIQSLTLALFKGSLRIDVKAHPAVINDRLGKKEEGLGQEACASGVNQSQEAQELSWPHQPTDSSQALGQDQPYTLHTDDWISEPPGQFIGKQIPGPYSSLSHQNLHREPKTGNRTASFMEVTSAMERSGTEPPSSNGHLPGGWPCPQEDRTCSLVAPQPLRALGVQLQQPSVLESKVRALKENMTAAKQGASPCLSAHEQPSPKKPKCRRGKVGGARPPWPDAAVVLHAQNPPEGQLDHSVSEEQPARSGGPRPPRPPATGLESCNGRLPQTPEPVRTLPDREERGLLPGPSSSQDSPVHRVVPGRPRGPRACNKITHTPAPKPERSFPLQDDLVTGGDLGSLSLTSEEDFVPRPALRGGLWRAGDLGALGTGGSTLSLSERVERNRLLLQEMLNVGGPAHPKVGIPARTPSWDRAGPERPPGDMDWDSGISLQDSDQSRTFGPKPEPVRRSPKHEEAKHLLQRARMKARTRPLRASHDIVPTADQGRRDGARNPALDRSLPFACRENLQNGSTSDSSSGESSSGQWPKRGPSPSHVRFEDESTRDAESRYLDRLQQRQRQGLSPALQTADQGPLRSKPELADYIAGGVGRRDAGGEALHWLVGHVDRRAFPAPPPPRGGERTCRACGSCTEDPRPAPGKAAPDPGVPQEREAHSGLEGVWAEPLSSRVLSAPLRLLPAQQRLCTERIRETHIGGSARPEEADSALDSTDTSDSCRTDSEDAGTSQPGRTRGSCPRPRGSRPRGSHRCFWKAETEAHGSPQAPHSQPGVDLLEVSDEVKEVRGHTPEGTLFPREDPLSKPPVQGPERACLGSLGSPGQPGPELGNPGAHPVDSGAPCKTACAAASFVKLASSGPDRQEPGRESHESLKTISLQQNHAEPSAPRQAQQPTTPLSPEGWVPTPPPSRKTTSPGSHRKAPRRPGDRGAPLEPPLAPSGSAVPRTCELPAPRTQPCSPQARHPLLALSTTNYKSEELGGLQEPGGGATLEDRAEKGPSSQEPEAALEDCRDGAGTVSSTGVTFSLALEEPESSREPAGGLQRTEAHSEGDMSSRNKKTSGSIATLGLKKFFLALGQGSRPKLGKSRSYSVEQLQPPAPGPASHASTPKVKRAPSLQSLRLVSPSPQHRKAASFQNLHSLLSGKVDRSSLYLIGEPGDHSESGRLAKAPPRRALSVEDVSSPSLARTVGRVVEVFPDGTSQLQLQRPPEGTFGFCVASGNGRRDSGFYVQEMADASTAKLYSGLLGVGDEILEVNGAKVAGLGLAHVKELLAHAENLSLRVLRQRPVPR